MPSPSPYPAHRGTSADRHSSPAGAECFNKLKVLDLFSGIGGFSLGLERTGGFETVAFCEIEDFPRRVLAKHWPDVPCYTDVRELTAERLTADGIAVDVICGGFPCQDLSEAGERAGIDGERSGLWREFSRLIGEVRPRVAVVENVPELLSGASGAWFSRVLGDLAALGYDAVWHCIHAADIGAAHIRDRLWIAAVLPDAPEKWGIERWGQQLAEVRAPAGDIYSFSNEPEPPRVADGVPNRMDRVGACGNAVVPQIPELIGRAILSHLGASPTSRVKSLPGFPTYAGEGTTAALGAQARDDLSNQITKANSVFHEGMNR